jgi:hypothetical protein
MKVRLFALALSFIVLAGIPIFAHHSFAATYFEDKTVSIEGKILQFQIRNPHSFVHVEVKDAKGELQRWAVEWASGGQLSATGVTNETLQAGDIVTITGNPGRNPDDHRVRLVSLRRKSDGYGWGQRPGETFQ